ncbi:MAG TPA: hypothetical protein ENG00_00820 [Candidatus Aenigmarchaeota archaeon]|nr:hypothetical protein [Candidatus Aenigmarchaeota archaeon]
MEISPERTRLVKELYRQRLVLERYWKEGKTVEAEYRMPWNESVYAGMKLEEINRLAERLEKEDL